MLHSNATKNKNEKKKTQKAFIGVYYFNLVKIPFFAICKFILLALFQEARSTSLAALSFTWFTKYNHNFAIQSCLYS